MPGHDLGRGVGQPVRTLPGHRGNVTAVAFTPDGRRLLSAGLDGTLKLWDLEAGTLVRSIELRLGRWAASVTFLADDRTAFAGRRDGAIVLWDLEAGSALGEIAAHDGLVRTLAGDQAGRGLISSGATDGSGSWDAKTATRRANSLARTNRGGSR